MAVSLELVKQLRDQTGAGIMNCRQALEETGGDINAAVEYLRKKGVAKASKLTMRKASEGLVHAYIHPGGRIGALVEINCETDFVARTDEFRELANNIALQVAATGPLALAREDLDADVLDKEREIYRSQALEEGKPEKVIDKIVEGKLEKFYEEACLFEQAYIKDPDTKVGDLVKEMSGKVGENVVVRRFSRFQLGDMS